MLILLCFEKFQILAVGATSTVVNALCPCRRHSASLAALPGGNHGAVAEWLTHCNSNHVVKAAVKKKEQPVPQIDLFQPVRDIVYKKDLNFIAGLINTGAQFNIQNGTFGLHGTAVHYGHLVYKSSDSVTCLRAAAPNMQQTQEVDAEKPSATDSEVSSSNNILKSDVKQVKYGGNNSASSGSESKKPDSKKPSLEQLEIVKEYYIAQVSTSTFCPQCT